MGGGGKVDVNRITSTEAKNMICMNKNGLRNKRKKRTRTKHYNLKYT